MSVPTKLDIIGKRFGKLVVYDTYYVKSSQNKNVLRCSCICDCGEIKENIIFYSLKNGSTKSCGCFRREIASKRFFDDLTNKKFNMLLVIERIENSNGGETKYLCLCDCGKFTKVFSENLKKGNTKSCGCYNKKLLTERKGDKSPNWKFGAWTNSISLYDTYAPQIEFCEEVRRDPENYDYLQVKCTYCGKWLNPTTNQIQARLHGIKFSKGESRFYCSNDCKKLCPMYGQIKYPKDYKQSISREIQPELRKMCFERDNWICQKCGSKNNLRCHHIEGVELNPIESADLDIVITLCKECHEFVHKQKGCGYYDHRCNK